MGRDLHFSIDSLPERYRGQVLAQIGGGARNCKSALERAVADLNVGVSEQSSRGEREREGKGVCGSGGSPETSAGLVVSGERNTKGGCFGGGYFGTLDLGDQKTDSDCRFRNRKPNPTPKPKRGKQGKVRAPITITDRESGMSKPERIFNRDFLGGRGKYEAITLNLPSGLKYTPDWMICDLEPGEDKEIELIEVKGNYHLQSHQRAATAFKTATALYPEFSFVWAEQQKNPSMWKIACYQGGKQVGEVFLGTKEDFNTIKAGVEDLSHRQDS